MREEPGYNFLEPLIPIGNDTLMDKEPFESYIKRVKHLAPNIPDCILENWIYRHYTSVVSDYAFLDFKNMKIERDSWSVESIYDLIKSYDEGIINNLGYQIYKRKDKIWLQKYMLEHRTWPVPIIVLNNKERLFTNPAGRPLGDPYHLLEGHLRLNYFREIYRYEKETLKNTHEVWKVTINHGNEERS